MRKLFGLSLLFCGLVLSCSNAVEENSSKTPALAGPVAVNSGSAVESTPAQIVASKSPPNPKNVVLFDGKNYIKKSGWKTPARKDAYIDDTTGKSMQGMTEKGKRIEIARIHYIYKSPWYYSQDFYYDGRDLDLMKGSLKAGYFLEMSVNGKVFMYSISGEKVVPPPASNTDLHEDPFIYDIMDADGDGIFETLFYGDDIIVPNWVLK